MASVIILNNLQQAVTVYVADESGSLSEIHVEPRGRTDVINRDLIADYTFQLEAIGHIKLIPVT